MGLKSIVVRGPAAVGHAPFGILVLKPEQGSGPEDRCHLAQPYEQEKLPEQAAHVIP